MFICRLFQQDRPFEQIDARLVAEGRITLGRDDKADWRLDDPTGALSRIHCTLEVRDEALWLRDCSTNGSFMADGARIAPDFPVRLSAKDRVRLGGLTLVVERASDAATPPDATTLHAAHPRPAPSDMSLLDAFCEGARLDASELGAVDPVELMRRAGAVYRETVAGLSALMQARGRARSEQDLERTTISAGRNNPFKWLPAATLTAAVLKGDAPGFLSDADAVGEAFGDLNAHMQTLGEAPGRAALEMLRAFSPDGIEAEARERGGLLKSRQAVCWDIHAERHAELSRSFAPAGERRASPSQAASAA